MIIIMHSHATREQVDKVVERVQDLGLRPHVSEGYETTIVGVIGQFTPDSLSGLELMPGVERLMRVSKPYKLSSRDFSPRDTLIPLNGQVFGGNGVVMIAGPCAVESEEQLWEIATAMKEAGVRILRAGAFKPRTSPYSFQGLGVRALEMLDEVRHKLGLHVVSEVLSAEDVELVANHVDVLQVGARNMQNFALLQEVGRSGHPVLLKRGMSAKIEELLMSAEYILANHNERVILCERGIRTFEDSTRFTLDISAVPVLKQVTHLPVIVDPSHAAGKWNLVAPIAKAAIAAGADGLIVEVHAHPDQALSDGAQALRPDRFVTLMDELRPIASAVGRRL